MKLLKRLILIAFILLFLAIGAIYVTISYYKKEMSSMLTTNLRDTYGLTLKIGGVNVSLFSNWPHASMQLKNVEVINYQFPDAEKKIFNAGSVSLSFNLLKLLRKQFVVSNVAIKDARIAMVKNLNGIKNFEIKRKDTTAISTGGISFEMKKVVLKNTEFSFSNKEKGQIISLKLLDNDIALENYSDGVDAKITGDVAVDQLLFKPEKGAFLKNTAA